MRFLLQRVPALFAVTLVVLFGCSRGTEKKEPGKQASSTGGDTIKLAFISNNAYQFWQFAARGTEKAAADLSLDAEVKMPPEGSAALQQQIIEDLLVRGVQGIAISPQDSKNMQSFFRTKIPKDVPLVLVDSDVPDPKVRRAYLGTNNYIAGRAAGALVAKALPEGGKIVIFVGQLDVQNAVERRQGVIDYLSGIDSKDIGKLTPNDATDLPIGKHILVATRTDGGKDTKCQDQAEDILAKQPDIAGVVGLWEYNPPALLRAVEKQKSKAAIIGFDENDVTLNGIRDGKIAGTIVQDPYAFGYQSMKILARLVKGDDAVLKEYPGIDADNRIFVEHRIISKDNVDTFHAQVKKLLAK